MSTARPSTSLIVLISGRGSNMHALARAAGAADSPYTVDRVLSDRPEAGGLALARELGIDVDAVPASDYANAHAFEHALAAVIDARPPTLIALAGFMRILSAEFVARYAGRILNIHPSLLPTYPGLHTHRRVLANGDTEHGATVHFVTSLLDGGPRVIQARTAVLRTDDEASLSARVLALEHRIYPEAVRWYAEGRLRCRDGCATLDDAVLEVPVTYRERAC